MRRQRSRRDLGVDEIIVAARALLHQEAGSLSMRRVAEVCGVTPMALYHHVADKQGLEDLVLDQVLDVAIGPPGVAPAGRAALVALALRVRRALMDNPGAAPVFTSRPVVVPATARLPVLMFEHLAAAGLQGDAGAEAADALNLVLMGSLVNDLTRPPRVRDQLPSKLPADEAARLAPHLPAYSHRDPEARFRTAYDWVLDGAAAR